MKLLPLLSLLGVVGALPSPVTVVSAPVDENDPSSGDPKTPPTSIAFPQAAENPFPSGIPDMPDVCDGQNPSDDCFNAMKQKNNYIWFDNESGCSDEYKAQITTAVWDASTLANYASAFPNFTANRGQVSGVFWMGSDWAKYQSRISENFGRAGKWKLSDQSEYITVSCTDTQNRCNEDHGDLAVGGYAWTYSGWLYYYHHITLCKPFFTLESLNDKIDDVENALRSGNTRYATDMTWLRTTGQYFLHEMMHLRVTDGGEEPHIGDQIVGRIAAYGPKPVHGLAKQDGGLVSTVNADSYALLANSLWWWDTTGYFPGIPKKTTEESGDSKIFQMFVNLYDGVNPATLSKANWDEIYAPQVQLYTAPDTDSGDVPTSTVFVTPIPAGPTVAA